MRTRRGVAAYGATAQPAIAARMAPHLRSPRSGQCVQSLRSSQPLQQSSCSHRSPGPDRTRLGGGALVSAALMLAICVIQVAVWRRAMASWLVSAYRICAGRSSSHGSRTSRRTRWPWSFCSPPWRAAPQLAGRPPPAVLLGVTLFFVLAAQVLAGVQFLRSSGPPGTLPEHIRRLKVKSRYRND